VVFNAAAAIMIGGKAPGFAEGIALAEESIKSGRARETLDKLIKLSNS
jgi:anthranilate phosphoribosyltransferase